MICCDRGYADPALRYPRFERKAGLTIVRVPSTSFGRRRAWGRLFDYGSYLTGAALVALAGPKPDVVVGLSTPPMLGLLALVVARLKRARAVYWVMDAYPEIAFELGTLRRSSLAGRCAAMLSRFTLASVDLVVALGETMAERLVLLGARRQTVVHNWADGRAVRPMPRLPNRFREANGWGERFVVLYSGNLGLVHEFDTALAAASRLAGRREILFAFVGTGPRRAELEAAVKLQGLRNVYFHDAVPREQLGESLAAGDLHLVTLGERMAGLVVPSKIYGVLAAGRPCLYIGPDKGEVHDILGRGACGTSVRSGDVEGAAAAVRRYADDPLRCRDEGDRARQLFEACFERQRQTQHLIEALSSAGRGHDLSLQAP